MFGADLFPRLAAGTATTPGGGCLDHDDPGSSTRQGRYQLFHFGLFQRNHLTRWLERIYKCRTEGQPAWYSRAMRLCNGKSPDHANPPMTDLTYNIALSCETARPLEKSPRKRHHRRHVALRGDQAPKDLGDWHVGRRVKGGTRERRRLEGECAGVELSQAGLEPCLPRADFHAPGA